MQKFIIAIMSHKRPEAICKKTLNYIYNNVSDPKDLKINIFLSDYKQKEEYEYFFNKYFSKKYPNTIEYIISGNSYLQKVNDIHMAYPVGTKVFVIEDDIIELSKMYIKDNKKIYKKIDKLDDYINNGFRICSEKKANIFGMYPVYNAYFSYNTISDDFRFLIANAFGFISSKDKKLLLKCDAKSDYERTIRYMLRDGKVIRFNDVAAKTNGYDNSGGFDRFDKRYKSEEYCCKWLIEKFPLMVKEKKCKSRYPEISLIKNFNKKLTKKKNMNSYSKKHSIVKNY